MYLYLFIAICTALCVKETFLMKCLLGLIWPIWLGAIIAEKYEEENNSLN